MDEPLQNERAPVIEPGYTLGSVTDKISSIVLTPPTSNAWFVGFVLMFLLTLVLLRQSWRNSINRFAEAMTLFAVASAGIFPAIHVGRPWVAYWLFPYPNTMNVWPQFRSPLVWDVFAVSTYATISALFWFIGLIPV